MDTSKQTAPSEASPVLKRPDEKIIQPVTLQSPTADQANHMSINAPRFDAASVYPEATKDISGPSTNTASQTAAIAFVKENAKEANRLICMRVKSVLVIGILLGLGGLSSLIVGLSASNGTVVVILALIQLGMAASLLTSKDQHTAAFILRVFLVLQAISLLLSLVNPVSFAESALAVFMLGYAYLRVNSLRY